MAPNLFHTAKTLPQKPAAAAAKTAEVIETEGLERYSALDHVEKLLKALKETHREPITEQMLDHFVEEGLRRGKRPDNYKGAENGCSASLEFRKRTSNSKLTDVELQLLEKYDVPVDSIEEVPSAFLINPKYAEDEELLAAVSNAISRVKNLPDDFLVRQMPMHRVVVHEDALDHVFAVQAEPETVTELARIVSTLAMKPKFVGGDVAALRHVIELMEAEAELGIKKKEQQATVDAIRATAGAKKRK
jgi:hypothetical protein